MQWGRRKCGVWMKEDNLLAVRRRKFVATTDSDHGFVVHPNLAEHLVLSDVNQLWVADITYVRLQAEFVYLAVVLDAFSRRAVGWALGRNLQTSLPLAALEKAIRGRQPQPGLVHHSDRGTQYASNDYVKRLESIGAVLSMSRPGRPWENGQCESFLKTLKQEEIDARPYHTMEELEEHLAEFIEQIYNQVRLHSALGYLSPEEFEARLVQPGSAAGMVASGCCVYGGMRRFHRCSRIWELASMTSELNVRRESREGRLCTQSARGAGAEKPCQQLAKRACQGAMQVIFGVSVATGKVRASLTEQRGDSNHRCTQSQQLFGNPFIGDTPIGLRESLWNVQPVQPGLIDDAWQRAVTRRDQQVGKRAGLQRSGVAVRVSAAAAVAAGRLAPARCSGWPSRAGSASAAPRERIRCPDAGSDF